MTFENFFIAEAYKKIEKLGDPLISLKAMIDWEAFRPIVASVYRDGTQNGGRPHTDELIIVRALILQAMYGLTDPQLEYRINDSLSFRNFVGLPETVPDFTTIWRARERLKTAGADILIWDELQRQLQDKGLRIEKGVIQDATIVEADLGRKRYEQEKRARREKRRLRRSKRHKNHVDQDGSFTVKNGQVKYGYKTHIKMDVKHQLIRDYEVTTASDHDSKVDLVEEGDGVVYRDKGYVGVPPKAASVKNETMLKAPRGKKLNGGQQRKNKRISRIRAPGERPFSVMKRTFNGARTYVKRLYRVSVKEMFKCFAYDLVQLNTLHKQGVA